MSHATRGPAKNKWNFIIIHAHSRTIIRGTLPGTSLFRIKRSARGVIQVIIHALKMEVHSTPCTSAVLRINLIQPGEVCFTNSFAFDQLSS
ncbi:hypothetical protein PUN28_005754 [Cardiocondyla obscurior]|uniref:Uncharacterized protein n=1 Tax=Cardiocondyla obscurior TaxID=286306 RepID=A0AAW2GB08_9HYME